MMIGATDRGLCIVQFGSSPGQLLTALRNEYPRADLVPMRQPGHRDFQAWISSLTNHLASKQPHLELPLDVRATAFQMRVWTYLQSIPLRRSSIVRGSGSRHRQAQSSQSSRQRVCQEQCRSGDPMPSSDSRQRRNGRIWTGAGPEANAHRSRASQADDRVCPTGHSLLSNASRVAESAPVTLPSKQHRTAKIRHACPIHRPCADGHNGDCSACGAG